jgi:hypothetical protein
MTDEERLSFFKDIIPLVRPKKIRWKAADWDNPTQWVSRGRGLPGESHEYWTSKKKQRKAMRLEI